MKKLLLIAALGATTLGGVAVAQTATETRATRPMRGDANSDGALSKAEFLAQAGARFDRMDANKDGRIERAERRTTRLQQKAKRLQRQAARVERRSQTAPDAR